MSHLLQPRDVETFVIGLYHDKAIQQHTLRRESTLTQANLRIYIRAYDLKSSLNVICGQDGSTVDFIHEFKVKIYQIQKYEILTVQCMISIFNHL